MSLLGRLFSFRGRLSRRAWRRRQLAEVAFTAAGIFAAILLVMAEAPRPLALLPLATVPVGVLAMISGWIRRLHDVGLAAHQVVLGALLWLALWLGPIGLWLLIGDPPVWFSWAVAIWIAGVIVVSLVQQQRLGFGGEWRLGDPDPNEFGPPPDA